MSASELVVSFLYFDGCPLAPRARANLVDALERLQPDCRVGMVEVDLMDPQTPDPIRRWGSPTILINGKDLADEQPGSASNCRIYPGSTRVPSSDEIATAIKKHLVTSP